MSSATELIGRVRGLPVPSVSDENKSLLLVLPGLFLFSAFMFFPMVYVVYLSFTNAVPANLFQGSPKFIWFENYIDLFFAEGATKSLDAFLSMLTSNPLSVLNNRFWNSFLLTWLFVGVSVVLKVVFSLSVALAVTGKSVRGSRLMRALLITPMGLPAVFTITVWRGIFSSAQYGLLNQLLQAFGLGTVSWLSSRWPAFFSYVVTEVWLAYPFMLIITVSALQDVPEDLMDAAKVDGAGYFSRFRHVTLPSIKRPVLFATILTAAASFQQVLIPYIFNRGGPARQNELILVYAYKEAFQFSKYGKGAAISLTAVLFIGMFMWINVKKGRLAEGVDKA